MSGEVLPQASEVLRWSESDVGQKVLATLRAIDIARHGLHGDLIWLYHDEGIAQQPPETQFEWLIEQMPIAEIRHAVYVLNTDELVLAPPDTFLSHRQNAFR